MEQVRIARSVDKPVDTLPERTDMSKTEIKELMQRPKDEVEAETRTELENAGYGEELKAHGFGGVADMINADMAVQSEQKLKPKRRVKKQEPDAT